MKTPYNLLIIATLLLTSMTSCEKDAELPAAEDAVAILDESYRGDLSIADEVVMPNNGKTYSMLEVLQNEELFEVYKNIHGKMFFNLDDSERNVLVLFDEDEVKFKSKESKHKYIVDEGLKRAGISPSKADNFGFWVAITYRSIIFTGKWQAFYNSKKQNVKKGKSISFRSNFAQDFMNKTSSLSLFGQVGRESGSVRMTFFNDLNQTGRAAEFWLDRGNDGYQIYAEVPDLEQKFNDDFESFRAILYGGN